MKDLNHLFETLFQYGFHDTYLSKVTIEKSRICFVFDGLYMLDKNGKETDLTNCIQLCIKINADIVPDALNAIEIREYKKGKRRFMDSEDFIPFVKNHQLSVCNVYFSRFENSLLIESGHGDAEYDIFVEQCVDFLFVSESE